MSGKYGRFPFSAENSPWLRWPAERFGAVPLEFRGYATYLLTASLSVAYSRSCATARSGGPWHVNDP